MPRNKIKKGKTFLKGNFETPEDLKSAVRPRFGDFYDPCPLYGREGSKKDAKLNGLLIDWEETNFINPPFNEIQKWIEKGVKELHKGKTCIFLLPVRKNTLYWQKYIIPCAGELLYFTNRITFPPYEKPLPIGMCLVVFSPKLRPIHEMFPLNPAIYCDNIVWTSGRSPDNIVIENI